MGDNTCDFVSPNLAYSEDTFKLVHSLAPLINKYSRQYLVPPIAVAGSIGDEFNTRSGFRAVVDWFQDDVLLNYMPASFIKLDAKAGFRNKLLNSTKHDIGKGNIKLETAREIFLRYREKFSTSLDDWSVLVDFIRSNEGTVQIAALVIKCGQEVLGSYLGDHPDDVREAVLVTYYKQGEPYVRRFLQQSPDGVASSVKYIKPGEGCRVLVQRERFKTALGLNQ
jgi:hypothetical protein